MKSAHKRFTLKKLKGFTLIELLIVIAIVGILAAVVLVALNPAERIRQARDAGRKSDIGQIATALEAFYTGNTPAQYPGGSACPGGLVSLTIGDFRRLPLDPEGGNYCYNTSADWQTAAVYATLKSDKESIDAGGTAGERTYFCWQSSTGKITILRDTANCN